MKNHAKTFKSFKELEKFFKTEHEEPVRPEVKRTPLTKAEIVEIQESHDRAHFQMTLD